MGDGIFQKLTTEDVLKIVSFKDMFKAVVFSDFNIQNVDKIYKSREFVDSFLNGVVSTASILKSVDGEVYVSSEESSDYDMVSLPNQAKATIDMVTKIVFNDIIDYTDTSQFRCTV